MKYRCVLLFCSFALTMRAQEATSGFELRATLSALAAASDGLTEEPRAGAPVDAGFRSVFYPVWKLDEHWTLSAAYQVASRPYFFESFSTQGHGVKGNILNGTVNYSRVARNRSLVVRVGELPTAFGSFLLHYDDMANALVDLPMQYGYYYALVSSLPVAGAQVDVTAGKWDARGQFANSSPVNPRSVFARDQYGNWAGGFGYTIRQGFRVGFSASRGPYLDRQYRYFFPGEENPNLLKASAVGVDVEWTTGHWNVTGEWQRFVLPYVAIPYLREETGYIEARRVLHPRWYVAARTGYSTTGIYGSHQAMEAALGFRPNGSQLVKIDYEFDQASTGSYLKEHTLAIQLVTALRLASLASK